VSAQRTEDVRSCLSRRPAGPASLSLNTLRGSVPKGSYSPVVGVLETQEALVRAALVGPMELGQEVERSLRGAGVSFPLLAAQPLETLKVQYRFGPLPALLPFRLGLGSLETGDGI